MNRFYSTLGIDNAIKEQERDNIKANNMLQECMKQFGSCQCDSCLGKVTDNNMPQNWEERFRQEFPRFACSDDYECPTIRTIGDNQDTAFDGEEIVSGDVDIKDRIKSFIKQIRQQDMEELIKINGYAEYEDRLKMIKEYYKQ